MTYLYWILGLAFGGVALYLLYTSPGSGCGGDCNQGRRNCDCKKMF